MANLVTEQEMFFNSFEPKLKNRFVLYMDGVPTFMVRSADRPKYAAETVTLSHINVERYVKGKSKWNAMNMVLYDPIVPSGAQAVIEWIRLSHESVTGRDGYADFYKKDLILNLLGPVGDKVEEWVLKGCFVTAAEFNTMDWGTANEVVEVNLTIQPDYCILSY